MTHHEFDNFDQKQRKLFLEAVERGEPIEQAMVRIKNETRQEFREIVLDSGHGFQRTDKGVDGEK